MRRMLWGLVVTALFPVIAAGQYEFAGTATAQAEEQRAPIGWAAFLVLHRHVPSLPFSMCRGFLVVSQTTLCYQADKNKHSFQTPLQNIETVSTWREGDRLIGIVWVRINFKEGKDYDFLCTCFGCIEGCNAELASAIWSASQGAAASQQTDLQACSEIGERFLSNLKFVEAADEGKMAAVEALLANGADVNSKDAKGATALFFAAQKGHTAIVQFLITRGADMNAKEATGGLTALMGAALKGRNTVVEALLAAGADVNAKDKNGDVALTFAANNRRTDVVKILLAAGADVNSKNNDGRTILDVVQGKSGPEIVKLLLKAGGTWK